ncbi:DUF7227 family protein [Nitrospira sp. BLG_2]|uniref:DUF7227 family protein n=1 Tax=Nitrospira sp. BLG_2 TaxID=3397507 RepID=UPI003B9CB3B4
MIVTAIETSENRKIGNCSATYASQVSCPKTCPFFQKGCYAETGPLGIHTKRLNKEQTTAFAVAQAEARAIGNLSGSNHLRLHVVGDSCTKKGTKLLANAAKRHTAKAGKSVWTYTHAWQMREREEWGGISVLASCENIADAKKAMKRNYAVAMVVPKFQSEKAYSVGKYKVIPCPNQTKHITCDQCRLCMDDKRLRDNKLIIGFEPHGACRNKIALTVLN